MLIQSSRWRVAVLFLIAAAPIALPQETKLDASVSGRVTNSATGVPVVRAHVTLNRGQQRFGALTGVDGRFSISPLPGANYDISVDAPGFQPLPGFWGVSLNRLALRSGEDKNGLDIALTPSGAISGRVLDAEGQPLQGMSLSILSVEGVIYGDPSPLPSVGGGGSSDPDGRYRFSNLPPGRYRVLAAPGFSRNLAPEIRTDGTTEVHYSPTYYPASLTLASAGRIDVQPGAECTGIDIRMVRTPIVAVRGTVSGIPASGSRVWIRVHKVEPPIRSGRDTREMVSDQRPVNENGSFVIWRLDPGSYVLVARSYPEEWVSPPLEITVADKDINGVVLGLVQSSDISGQGGTENGKLAVSANSGRGRIAGIVRDDAGPTAYARVALLPELESLQGDPLVLTADSNGAYSFPSVDPGKYRIMALDADVKNARALGYHLDDYQDVLQIIEIHPGDKLILNLRRHSRSK
jgi:hypothetical protein